VYWIDGTQVATHAISIAGVMQPAISDYNVAGGQVVVDWVHLTPYASTATFASRVLDAGASVNWLAANWKSVLPAGTNLVISERTGDAPTPDGSWTGWTQLAGSGAAVAGYSRYIQYQAQLSTSNVGQTPELDNITFTFNPGVRTTPPIISNISVSSITTTGATISWTTDEPSTTQVNYGTTTSLGSSASSGGSVTSHSVALSGLASGTQYFYQVKSVDSNNNVGVSAQSSFSTVAVRTVPPVISNVVVTPGSGGTATISWTTDEVATSQVNYGTTSTTLNSTVSNSTMVTSHSLTLSGLALGVKYFYQVSSLDVWGFTGTYPASGNPPASFTMPPGTLIDTTVADFSAGTPDANTYISQTNNGEVILNPTAGAEFSGTTLQSGWAVQTIWNTGGSAVVTNGTVTVDAASVGTTATYGPGSSMEFVATFSTDTYENAGLGVDFSTTPWAIFSTKDGSALFVRTNNGATSTDTAIPGNWIGTPHRYRIDWTTSGVVYSIDGTQVASHPIAITTNMRPLVSDYNLGNGALVVDWIRLTPYSTPAVFVSRVLDAGASVNWLNAKWTSVLPAGTALTISVRTGNTATPDATWTVFTAVSSSGGSLTGSSRYIQYQAQLSTTNSTQTPALNDITLSYSQPIP
jgi:phage tail protein X